MFVQAASTIAVSFGISPMVIGATIVSLATTLPEIIVSLLASASQCTEMAVGNAIGSVTVNTSFIMALSLFFLTVNIPRKEILFNGLLMAGSTFFLWIFTRNRSLSILESFLLLALFSLFMWGSFVSAKNKEHGDCPSLSKSENGFSTAFKFVIGSFSLFIGSRLLVNNACFLASALGISERIIAVTIVAIGTALPELVTAVVAIVKKQGALAVGNILGANIIDITIILPLCAVISGKALAIPNQSASIDIPFCLLTACIAIAPPLLFHKFYRWQGVVLLGAYCLYLLTVLI